MKSDTCGTLVKLIGCYLRGLEFESHFGPKGLGPFVLICAAMWLPLIGPRGGHVSTNSTTTSTPSHHPVTSRISMSTSYYHINIVLPHQLPNHHPSIFHVSYHIIIQLPCDRTVYRVSQWDWWHISCPYIHTCHMSFWDATTSFGHTICTATW